MKWTERRTKYGLEITCESRHRDTGARLSLRRYVDRSLRRAALPSMDITMLVYQEMLEEMQEAERA